MIETTTAGTTSRRRPRPRGVYTPRLRALRDHAALTQIELARAAGVGESTVLFGETGRRANASSARRLAAALGVPVQALMEAPA